MRAVKHIVGINKENLLDVILSEERDKDKIISNFDSTILLDKTQPNLPAFNIETKLIIDPIGSVDWIIKNLSDI